MTRREMKKTAKDALHAARPGPVAVTLVYTLLTSAVGIIVPFVMIVMFGLENIIYMLYSPGMDYGMYEIIYYYLGGMGTTVYVFLVALSTLFSAVLTYGYVGYCLRVSRMRAVGYGNLLDGFGMVGRVIALHFLTVLFVALWNMLFIIPGIIAAYRYRMAYFIMLDDPDCGALEAIRRSKGMMRGHKARLFVFDLSFVNWALAFVAVSALCTAATVIAAPEGPAGYTVAFIGAGVALALISALSLWVRSYMITSQAVYYGELLKQLGRRPGSYTGGVIF